MLKGKTCTKCKEFKSLDNFYNAKRGKYGKGQRCKECFDKINKQCRENKKLTETKICDVKNCENKVYIKGLCNAHYLRKRRYGDPNIKKAEAVIKLDFEINENGCFEVISHKPGTNGYPQVQYNKRTSPAHRKVYEEMFGKIPKGLMVRHKCDNRLCINPEHFELGTFEDNMNDKIKRNRQAKGEAVGSHKLTEKEVIEIKTLLKSESIKQVDIARKYKIKPSTLCDIKKGRTWGHVKVL